MVKSGRVVRSGTLAELTGGEVEVEVRAAGLTSEALAEMASLGKLTELEAERFRLGLEDEEILPELVDRLVAAGARVYEVSPHRPSLEEVFLRVMTEEGV
jgi:ABC-2 type transport system ATP-binding protein